MKTQLNKNRRRIIELHGIQTIEAGMNRVNESLAMKSLLTLTNAMIRDQYPEVDMVVLRRYKMTCIDLCVKYHFASSRFAGYTFRDGDQLAESPRGRHCQAYEATAAVEKAYDTHAAHVTKNKIVYESKIHEFNCFLASCRTALKPIDPSLCPILGLEKETLTLALKWLRDCVLPWSVKKASSPPEQGPASARSSWRRAAST